MKSGLQFISIITIITSTLIGCSVHGTYKNRFNDGFGKGWIKIRPDNTFEYISWGHMTGYGYTKGSWVIINDTLRIREFQPKLPITNELIEINDGNKTIEIVGLDGEQLTVHNIRLNERDTIEWNWDGKYSYKNLGECRKIEVFTPTGTIDNPRYQIIGDFNVECSTCSYKIAIDWQKIGFKSIFNLDTVWLQKGNRLYPLNPDKQKTTFDKNIFYKKTDTIIPLSLWELSWNKMKNGFD